MVKIKNIKTANTPSKEILPWLTYVDLLTEKLYKKSGETKLLVLQERYMPANWWDRYVLKLGVGMVFCREIVTSAWGEPCWYARTIIPSSTLEANSALFARLKKETLGELIFGDNNIQRESLSYYSISKKDIEFYWLEKDLCKTADFLWVRLSEFTLKNKDPFYLVEILLPGLERYI